MAEQLTDKEEFSKRISDKRRSRADKGKVGAAISPAELRRLGKAGLKGAAISGLTGAVGGALGSRAAVSPRDLAKSILSGAAMSRAERDRIRKAIVTL